MGCLLPDSSALHPKRRGDAQRQNRRSGVPDGAVVGFIEERTAMPRRGDVQPRTVNL